MRAERQALERTEPEEERGLFGLSLMLSAIIHGAAVFWLALFTPGAEEGELFIPSDTMVQVELVTEVPARVAAPAPVEEAPVSDAEVARAAAPPARRPDPEVVAASWRQQMLAQVQEYKVYPDEARRRREEATVMVKFTMDRGGRVIYVRVLDSSGNPLLDQAAMDAVKRASPLPEPPPGVPGSPIAVVLPVAFMLE
ncbi:MAG TPA: energy transducer TonB [Azospirillaceae bacterium]|nr:energy transducer TonB [Azospirillaceae bacterium]